jgi:hypothetical protein
MSDDNYNFKDNATIAAEKENELLQAEKSGSRQDIANTYLSELNREKELKIQKQKDKDFENLIENYQSKLLKELDDLFNQINEKLDEYKASRKIQNRMALAEQNGDFDELRKIFIDEYGMDTDKVNNMSEQELREQRIQFDELEQQKQAVIISDIRELAEKYRQRAKLLGETHPELAQKELNKLDAIKYKCAAMGLDFEKIFSDTVQNGYNDFHIAEYKKSTEDLLNTKFNKVAPNSSDSNPFLENEKDLAKIPSPFD